MAKAEVKKQGGRIRDRFVAPAAAPVARVRRTPASIRAVEEVEAPRAGTKGALVVRMLSRRNGATLVQLGEATGWLEHSTRAYFVALRKRGYPVLRVAKGAYRIEAAAA